MSLASRAVKLHKGLQRLDIISRAEHNVDLHFNARNQLISIMNSAETMDHPFFIK
jgi:hypothetical protein